MMYGTYVYMLVLIKQIGYTTRMRESGKCYYSISLSKSQKHGRKVFSKNISSRGSLNKRKCVACTNSSLVYVLKRKNQ